MANDHHSQDKYDETEHPERPATVDEAVDRLVALLSEQNKQAMREAEHVILFHLSQGM